MASHAIFQYNVLAIDDIHNTWTNMIVKMTILKLLGSSDDKDKIGVARPKGPPLRGFRPYVLFGSGAPEEPTPRASVHPMLVGRTDAMLFGAGGNRSQVSLQAPVEPTVQERASVHWPSFIPETMSSAQEKFLQHRFNRWGIGAYHRCNDVSIQEKIPSTGGLCVSRQESTGYFVL